MRAMWVAVMVVGLSGPALAWSNEDPAITVCEAAVKSVLRSPRSYERVSAKVDGPSAIIEYEAQNAYGVFIRTEQICGFSPSPDGWKIDRISVEEDDKRSTDDPTIERKGTSSKQWINQMRSVVELGLLPIDRSATGLSIPKGTPQGADADALLVSACEGIIRRAFQGGQRIRIISYQIDPPDYGKYEFLNINITIDYEIVRIMNDPIKSTKKCTYYTPDGTIGDNVSFETKEIK